MKTRLEEIDSLQVELIQKFVLENNLSDDVMRGINRFATLEVERHDILKNTRIKIMNYDVHFKWLVICVVVSLVSVIVGGVKGIKVKENELKELGCEIRYRKVTIDNYTEKWKELVFKDGAVLTTSRPDSNEMLKNLDRVSKEFSNDCR